MIADKLKEKRINLLSQIQNPYFEIIVEERCFRLLGVNWKEYIKWYYDKTNGDFVIKYI